MRLLMLVLVAMTVAACSDRVPAPTTPTPTPRPGNPPAPVSELPEGVLFVQQPSGVAPLLFGIGADGKARPYARTPVVSVSPDGSRAAVWTQDGTGAAGIGIMTGTGFREIGRGPWGSGSPTFSWSSDGNRLAYTIPDDSTGGKVWVRTLDTSSGEQTPLIEEPDSLWVIGWTATGDVLVMSPGKLDLLGETRRTIPLPEPGDIRSLALSPDHRSVAVAMGESEQSGGSLTYVHSTGIWVLGLARGEWKEIVDLADEPAGVQTTGGQEMQWSPDGRRITVHRTRMDESGMIADGLSVVDVETGKETLVHKLGWGWESWSPDGRYLAYMHYAGIQGVSADQRLSILGPDGRKREVEAHARQMAWTSDARLLLDIPGRLSLLDPGTMRMEEVLTDEGRSISAQIEAAVWSPSGRYVAVSTPADQYHRSSLYVVDTEEGTAELFLDEAGFSAVAWLRE